jgi:hypothetical protein
LELKGSYSYNDVHKLNELIKYPSSREAFINALLAKGLLGSNNITIDVQQYIVSPYYLIKAVGFNASTKLAPEDFITFHVYMDYVEPSFGKQISEQVKVLFRDLIHF